MKILLIDDHEIVRRGLKQLLSEGVPGAIFGDASSMKHARELLGTADWDLILLDINLPDGNGLDFLTEARQHNPNTAILVISAYPEAEFATRSFRLGASGYLTKASVADEMLAAVKRIGAGGKYVTASMAENLAAAIGEAPRNEPHLILSPRELEVLKMVALGKTIKEIAGQLTLSEKTIGTYRSRISEKLGISTNVALARYALKHKLVE